MGSTSSRIAKKISAPFRAGTSEGNEYAENMAIERTGNYLVYSRRGSMYKDEDGDLAHEFYIEVPSIHHGCKSSMKRVFDNLTPQGEVYYDIARLHVDFPYIISNV